MPGDSEDSQAEQSAASDESDDAGSATDADDFQQPIKRKSTKSAYDVDVSDREEASDSDDIAANRRGTRRPLRSAANRSNATAPARRQPRRTAAVKGSLAESPSDSSKAEGDSSVDEQSASDDNQEDSTGKKRASTDRNASRNNAKRQKALAIEDSNNSMPEAPGEDAQVISDSEAQSAEESDKENRPTRWQTRSVSSYVYTLPDATALVCHFT